MLVDASFVMIGAVTQSCLGFDGSSRQTSALGKEVLGHPGPSPPLGGLAAIRYRTARRTRALMLSADGVLDLLPLHARRFGGAYVLDALWGRLGIGQAVRQRHGPAPGPLVALKDSIYARAPVPARSRRCPPQCHGKPPASCVDQVRSP